MISMRFKMNESFEKKYETDQTAMSNEQLKKH